MLLSTVLPHAGELAAARASGGTGQLSLPHSNGTEHPALLLGECAALLQPPEAAEKALQQEQSEQQHAMIEQAVAAAHADAAGAVQALMAPLREQQHAITEQAVAAAHADAACAVQALMAPLQEQQKAIIEQAVAAAHADAAGAVQALMAPLRELAEQLPALLAVAPRLAELPAHLDAVPWKSAEVCNAALQSTIIAPGKHAAAEHQAYVLDLLLHGSLCLYFGFFILSALYLLKVLAAVWNFMRIWVAPCPVPELSPWPCRKPCIPWWLDRTGALARWRPAWPSSRRT